MKPALLAGGLVFYGCWSNKTPKPWLLPCNGMFLCGGIGRKRAVAVTLWRFVFHSLIHGKSGPSFNEV